MFLALVAGALLAFRLPSHGLLWTAAAAVGAWQVALVAYAAARPAVFGIAALASLSLSAAAAAQHEDHARRHAPVRAFAPPAGAVAPMATPRLAGDAIVLEGVLREDAVPRGDAVTLRLRVERVLVRRSPIDTSGGVSVSVGGQFGAAASGEWTRGRRIRVPATLRRPARYLNDGVADGEKLAAWRGTALVGSVKSASLVEVIAHATPLEEAVARVRARVRRALASAMAHDPEAAAVAVAILIGDRAGLSDDVERRLQRAGTYHVIAISGGNIALFAALAWAVARLLLRGRRAAIVTAMVIVAAYGLMVGAGASVGRAVIAAMVVLAATLVDHRAPPINALAAVGIAFLAWDPLALADVGFLLSFGATAGILIAMPMWLPALERRLPAAAGYRGRAARGAVLGAVAIILASAAAELVLLPIQAAAFHRLTLAGLALNLIAIPAMATVQVAGMALVALDVAGFAGVPVAAAICRAGARTLVDSAGLVDVWPWLAWRVASPPWWLIAAYAAACATALWNRRPRLRAGFVAVAAGTAAAIVVSAPARLASEARVTLTMLDVGQAEAMVLRLPSGRALLVDAAGPGGAFDIGDRVVVPALLARGIRRLDAFVLTHPDVDHIGGSGAIVTDLVPPRLFEGIAPARHPERDALVAAAGRAGMSIEALRAGGSIAREGVVIRVLHPPPPDWERQRVRNDDSLVLEVLVGDIALLLTGDAGEAVERAIASRLAPARVRILKAGHHGSRTSTSAVLLEAARPAAALISAGRGNLYGHPHPSVIAQLEAAGASVFRTDRDGQIDVATDGREVEIRTWSGRAWRIAARPAR